MNTRIITVSREVGSGGRTIGQRVAERLGIPCYDRELVAKIARESGLAESFIKENGEYAESAHAFLFNWSLGTGLESGVLPISDQLYLIQHNIIQELAEKESCVIVGRCADWILRERADCLHRAAVGWGAELPPDCGYERPRHRSLRRTRARSGPRRRFRRAVSRIEAESLFRDKL